MLAVIPALLAVASLLSAPPPQIHVYSCQTFSGIFVPQPNEVGLAVRFTNTSDLLYRSIVWRAAYGDGYVDFVDNGSFAPNVSIDNFVLYKASKDHISIGNVLMDLVAAKNGGPGPNPVISQNLFNSYAGLENPENCSIVSAVDSSGETWINPDIALPHVRLPAAAAYGLKNTAPTPAPTTTDGIAVSACVYTFEQLGWMDVRFRNTGQQAVRKIVFRAPFRGSAVDFTDVGTFSPNVDITHSVKTRIPSEAHATVYASFDDPSLCSIVSVSYADGTTWQNPAIASTPGPFATAAPNMLDFGKERNDVWNRAQVHGTFAPPASPSPSPTPTTQKASLAPVTNAFR